MKHNQPVKKSQFGENFGCYRNIIVAAQAADAADSYLRLNTLNIRVFVWDLQHVNPRFMPQLFSLKLFVLFCTLV